MNPTTHAGNPALASRPASAIQPGAVERVASKLIARHGGSHAAAIQRGVRQVAERWWDSDGDQALFESFCVEQYVAEEAERATCFARLLEALEQVDGHLHEIRRELHRPVDLDLGPVSRVDFLLQDVDLWAHVDEDLFRAKVAFLALLNFPVHTLEERLAQGSTWEREAWARSRMMDRFAERVPAPVLQGIARAIQSADYYIAEYNIQMDRLRSPDGTGPFPRGLRLISHWGLRDELKSRYDEGEGGLLKQRMIYQVMRRIVRQEIPGAVRDNPDVTWCPETNEIKANGSGPSAREPDTRYRHLLEVFRSVRSADPYAPATPTFIRRRFELDRQIPEVEVEALIRSVLESPEVAALAKRVAQRLGRPLEPFDIWYSGFMPRGARSEEELDRVVRGLYPTVAAFQDALPKLLRSLGFSKERAGWLADRIVVDAARGAGHALGAARREDKAHLRTRAHGGMSYKSFNIAMHELGHNVEQVFSLNAIDHWSLSGVPNTAFTEAFAFVFQSRDLEILGLPSEGEAARRNEVLQSLWATYEIGGVSLVDMKVWNWMYANPLASPTELRDAVVSIAREVWNRWYAPIFGERDVELLAIYSHLIQAALYLPDYAIGQIVAFQVAPRLKAGPFGEEMERMARLGRLTPDAWMRAATGGPLSTRPLLEAARAALESER